MPLEIIAVKKPYVVSFSGNPIPFVFAMSPYSDKEKTQDIRAEISILIEQNWGTNIFEVVHSQTFFPDADGMISFDVSSIIDPYLAYYMPNLSLSRPVVAPEQSKRCKLSYFAQKDSIPLAPPVFSDIFNVIKGGMAYAEWHPSEFFEVVVSQNKSFLAFAAKGESAYTDQNQFLYFVNYLPNATDLLVKFLITLSNGTIIGSTVGDQIVLRAAAEQWQVVCIPVGFTQLAFSVLLLPGTLPVSYSVAVISGGDSKTGPFTYAIDHRNFYDPHDLLYRNSTGGLNAVRLRGQVDFEADYDRQTALRTVAPSYYSNLVLDPQNVQSSGAEETEKFKGDTGFISKESLLKLRELMLSTEVFEVLNNKLVPVSITQKNTKFFSNKDNLLSMQVEWQRAYVNNFYTPAGLMPSGRTCPAVESLSVRQRDKQTLQVMYALQIPYSKVHIKVIYLTNAEEHDYYFTGNARTIFVKFQLPTGLTYPQSIEVQARTVCNEYLDDYGPVTSQLVNVIGNQLPIAIDDYFKIAAGFTTPVALDGSVLANDYDPDGDDIEAVSAGGPTTDGGAYNISADGTINYIPPSAGYNGEDSFTYQVREVGGTVTVSATVRISVGLGQAAVFVRVVVLNQQSSATGGSFNRTTTTTGQVWLFFYSDPAGTVPVSVTGLGLLVNTNKRVVTTDYTTSPDTIATVNTGQQYLGSGTQTKIYEGEISLELKNIAANALLHSRYTTYQVTTGAGYTGI